MGGKGSGMKKTSNFDVLQQAFGAVNLGEDLLRSMRDHCDTETQQAINKALGAFGIVRDSLWKVDGSLAKGKGT